MEQFTVCCKQEVFADVKDDDDAEFEIVPVKPSKTPDDFSDGLFRMNILNASVILMWL